MDYSPEATKKAPTQAEERKAMDVSKEKKEDPVEADVHNAQKKFLGGKLRKPAMLMGTSSFGFVIAAVAAVGAVVALAGTRRLMRSVHGVDSRDFVRMEPGQFDERLCAE